MTLPKHEETVNTTRLDTQTSIALLATFGLFVGLLLVTGSRRALAPDEATTLLLVRGDIATAAPAESPRPPTSITWQRGWSAVAGDMERPARWFAICSTIIGLAVIASWARLRAGGHAVFGMLFAAFAMTGATWEATGIATSAPMFAVMAGVVGSVAWLTGIRGRLLFVGTSFACAALPFLFAWLFEQAAVDGAVVIDDANSWLDRLADVAGLGSFVGGPIVGATVIGIILGLVFALAPRCRIEAVILVAAIAVGTMPRFGALESTATASLRMTWWVPLLMLVVYAVARSPRRRMLLVGLGILAAVQIGTVVARQMTDKPRRSYATILDSVHVSDPMTARAWLLACGPERDAALLFERSGHRTGMRVVRVPEDGDETTIARDAAFRRIPVLVVFDIDTTLREQLAPRYEVVSTPEATPAGITVFRFRS